MTRTVNIHEAKTNLSRLLERISEGEEILIAKAGRPVARLVPAGERPERREPGSASGKVVVREDFDATLPSEVTDDAFDFWENEEDEEWNTAAKE